MTLDGLITFLGLIAAALAIVSPVTRLQIGLAARRLTVWSFAFITLVLYFEFFDLLGIRCPSMLVGVCPTVSSKGPVTPQQAAFVVVFIWLAVLARALQRPRYGLSSLAGLDRLLDRLAESERYAELVDVAEGAIDYVADCAMGRLPFQQRRTRWAEGREVGAQLKGSDPAAGATCIRYRLWIQTRFRTFQQVLKRDYVKLLPSDAEPRAAAKRILQTVLRNGSVVDWIARNRPRFGARLLSLHTPRTGDFSERFLGWLIANPGSALYEEIKDNQNLATCGYRLEAHNAVLRGLFADARIAEKLESYRPIGDHTVSVLNPVNAPDYPSSLNRHYDHNWGDRGCWRDPTYVAIRFFDIMVRAAACQGIPWHMWLYYTPTFVERIEAFYEDQTGEDANPEYPTRAAHLLYAAIDALTDWVEVATQVDRVSVHWEPQSTAVRHQNDNIPKSAALALGICMRTIILSDRIPDRTKRFLLEVALGPARKAELRAHHPRLRGALLASLLEGGVAGGGSVYRQRLRAQFEIIYEPWHDELDDFRAMLYDGA